MSINMTKLKYPKTLNQIISPLVISIITLGRLGDYLLMKILIL